MGGKFIVKARQHIFDVGESISVDLPLLPENTSTAVRYHFADDDGVPYANKAYTAYYANGREVKGVTDKDGYTKELHSTNEQEIKVLLDT